MEGGSLMNAMLGNFPTAEVRASDADRDTALSDLSEHFQAGRLTAEEFEDRAGRALSARTWGQLEDLLRDLPGTLTGPQASAAVASAAGRPERPSGRGAPAPIAVLAVIGIAVAVSVGIAHSGWGLLPVVFGLLIVRRLIRHAGIPAKGLAPAERPALPACTCPARREGPARPPRPVTEPGPQVCSTTQRPPGAGGSDDSPVGG